MLCRQHICFAHFCESSCFKRISEFCEKIKNAVFRSCVFFLSVSPNVFNSAIGFVWIYIYIMHALKDPLLRTRNKYKVGWYNFHNNSKKNIYFLRFGDYYWFIYYEIMYWLYLKLGAFLLKNVFLILAHSIPFFLFYPLIDCGQYLSQ